MSNQIRLILYSNDAMVLASSNLYFPIKKINSISKKTTSTSSSIEREFYTVRTRITDEIIPKTPEKKYLTLDQRIILIPKGYSWKIDEVWFLFQRVDDANVLHFKKHTLHPRYFRVTERTHEYIINKIESIWGMTLKICREQNVELGNLRNSFLELVDIDGDESKAIDEKLLYIISSAIKDDSNPLSKLIWDVVYKTEKSYKTWEYLPQSLI